MSAVDFEFEDGMPLGALSSKGLSVKFYTRQVRNQELSVAEGRPIHEPVEFVQIFILGDKTNIIDRPIEPFDRQRFEKEYTAFKANKADFVQGQPLKDWPTLPENLAEDWAAIGVRSVEQLAEVPEHTITKLGPQAMEYQRKAKKYLEAASAEAPIHFMQAELDKRDALLADMQRQLAALKGEAPSVIQPPPGAVPMSEADANTIAKAPLIRKKV